MGVFVSDEQSVAVDVEDLLSLARHVLRSERVPADMECSLLLVDAVTMAELNAQHMDAEGPTDVLAFPIDEPGETPPEVPAVLGDVVLCPEVAERQASALGRTRQDELRLLTVHGILHLLGMDHGEPSEEREMFELTDRLLAAHGDTARSAP